MSERDARGPEENEHLFIVPPTKYSDGQPTFSDRDISLTKEAPAPHVEIMSNVSKKNGFGRCSGADAFLTLGLIPKPIVVCGIAWFPPAN